MRTILLLALIIFFTNIINAQILSSTNTVKASINDAKLLTKAYLTPFERGVSSAGANGFVNFTKTDKKISFNIGVNFVGAITPLNERTYDVNSLGLEEVKASDPNNSIAQTFSGDETSIQLETTETYKALESGGFLEQPTLVDKPIATFTSPEGTGLHFVALPMITAGIYTFGTHINFRILPKLHLADNQADVFSFGGNIQHNLKQFIKPLKDFPVEFSFLVGFQQTYFNYFLDVKPDETRYEIKLQDNGPYDNQVLKISTTSIPLQFIISKNYKGFDTYVSLGYNITNSNVALVGRYPVYKADPTNTMQILVEDFVDPFAYRQTHNEFRFDVGMQYQIWVVKIYANYTFAKYNAFNFGLGINF